MVRRGCTNDLLDLRILLHSSVPHGRASKLREEVLDPDRSARLRFHSYEGDRFHQASGRRCLRVRSVPGRGTFQQDDDEAGRVAAENSVRRGPLRE